MSDQSREKLSDDAPLAAWGSSGEDTWSSSIVKHWWIYSLKFQVEYC